MIINTPSDTRGESLPTTQAPAVQIAIVGGGLTGACLALLLAQSLPGCTLQLIDTKPLTAIGEKPSFDGRSSALAPTSVLVLKQLGLWSAVAPWSTPLEQIEVSHKGRWGMARFDTADNQGHPLGYVVQNAALGQALAERIAQIPTISTTVGQITRVHFSAQAAHFTGNVNFTGDAISGSASLLILADGADSHLRNSLGIGARIQPYGQTAVVAQVSHSRSHQLTAFERFSADGPLALLPLGGRASACDSTLVFCQSLAATQGFQTSAPQEQLSLLQKAFGDRLGHFSALRQAQYYPLQRIIATESVRSRLVVMGNAAHSLHPVAGQGFNLTMRDCLALCAALQSAQRQNRDLGDLSVLMAYRERQEIDQDTTLSLSHLMTQAVGQRWPLSQALTDVGLLILETCKPARQSFLSLLAGRH